MTMTDVTKCVECKCDQSLAKPCLNVRAKFMLAHQMMTLKTKTCTPYQQMTTYLGGGLCTASVSLHFGHSGNGYHGEDVYFSWLCATEEENMASIQTGINTDS